MDWHEIYVVIYETQRSQNPRMDKPNTTLIWLKDFIQSFLFVLVANSG